MITVNKKWIRLIGIVGCTVWMASCKQAPDAGVKSSYAVMQIEPTDKELSSSYSATIRGRQDIRHLSAGIGNNRETLRDRRSESTSGTVAFHH